MTRPFALTILLSGSVLASGCLSSILPDPAPAPTVYRLNIPSEDIPNAPNATAIRVDRPGASQAFEGMSIALSDDGKTLLSAEGARWVEPLPALIQDAMIAELGSRPNLVGILPISGARTELRIYLAIQDFTAVFDRGRDNPPEIRIMLSGTLAESATRDFLGATEVEQVLRAEDITVSAIVEAERKAVAAAISDMADWLEENLAAMPES